MSTEESQEFHNEVIRSDTLEQSEANIRTVKLKKKKRATCSAVWGTGTFSLLYLHQLILVKSDLKCDNGNIMLVYSSVYVSAC